MTITSSLRALSLLAAVVSVGAALWVLGTVGYGTFFASTLDEELDLLHESMRAFFVFVVAMIVLVISAILSDPDA